MYMIYGWLLQKSNTTWNVIILGFKKRKISSQPPPYKVNKFIALLPTFSRPVLLSTKCFNITISEQCNQLQVTCGPHYLNGVYLKDWQICRNSTVYISSNPYRYKEGKEYFLYIFKSEVSYIDLWIFNDAVKDNMNCCCSVIDYLTPRQPIGKWHIYHYGNALSHSCKYLSWNV